MPGVHGSIDGDLPERKDKEGNPPGKGVVKLIWFAPEYAPGGCLNVDLDKPHETLRKVNFEMNSGGTNEIYT